MSATTLAGRRIQRMNGAGNRILVLDLRGASAAPSPAEARAIHRAPGLAYDQMMALMSPRAAGTAAFVLIYNNDGSLAGACGNGTRCVADRLARELGVASLAVETQAGVIGCERLGPWSYRIDMGPPRLGWRDIPLAHAVEDTARVSLAWAEGDPLAALGPAATASMGNPHAAFFLSDLERVDAAGSGARIEVHPMFPEKVNVTFARIDAPDALSAVVWERGVGLTLACGSAACAAVVSGVRLGRLARRAAVRLPGGELVIEWRETDRVLMTGPVEFEAEFVLDAALFEAAA
ncbi:diaminopimelate epimerase [Roseiarcus fermentans]|uniref:Diaminopimelate epimerase n=1 Tax=Roseiarcus fermentans TaxID=1473586 RepID=A0A366F5B6_9HYPH|nr:diaminopimelate epimerase [Roseiarcus fermentans]RBP09842.1 diaminopimelate epimerase [Roseiarcus fermentans]